MSEHDILPGTQPLTFAKPVKPIEAETWAPVTFYTLPTGEEYLHFGARATPKVSS